MINWITCSVVQGSGDGSFRSGASNLERVELAVQIHFSI